MGHRHAAAEFLHVDDCADAIIHLAKTYSGHGQINIGSGEDITILDLAKIICEVVGFRGTIAHDLSKPDGMPCKLMDSTKLRKFGWRPRLGLKEGIAAVYNWFIEHELANAPPISGRAASGPACAPMEAVARPDKRGSAH